MSLIGTIHHKCLWYPDLTKQKQNSPNIRKRSNNPRSSLLDLTKQKRHELSFQSEASSLTRDLWLRTDAVL